MSGPVLVRIEESGDDERAFVDGAPVVLADGESAREAALRVVLAEATEPRAVDILMPSGVVLHVEAGPAGRLRVLGQTSPPNRSAGVGPAHSALVDDGRAGDEEGTREDDEDDVEAAARARVEAAVAAAARCREAADRTTDDGWSERDDSWPRPADTPRRAPHDSAARAVPPSAPPADPTPATPPLPMPTIATEHDAPEGDAPVPGPGTPLGIGAHDGPDGADVPPDVPVLPTDASEETSPAPEAVAAEDSPTARGDDPVVPSVDDSADGSVGGLEATTPEDEDGARYDLGENVDDVPDEHETPPADRRPLPLAADDGMTAPVPAGVAAPDEGAPQHQQDPSGETDQTDPTAPAGEPRRLRSLRHRWVLPAVLCAVLGLGGVGTAAVLHRDPAPAAEPVLTGRRFPQSPPDGWDARAAWASPPIDRASRVAVSGATPRTDGKPTPASPGTDAAVAFVTATRAMSVVDAATGRARWSAALPEGELRAGPAPTHVGGAEGFAVQVGDRALVWAVDDGRVLADAELPPRAELVTAGEAPMVRLTATRAALLTSDGLGEVEVPAGATALAGRRDGTVLVASPKGWWHMAPATVAGAPTPWEPVGSPADQPRSAPVVVGMTGTSVVLVHPDRERPRLVVHHDGPAVRGSFQGPYVPATNPTWAPSPSGSWGILGRSLVDVDAGRVTDLGDWRTVLVGDGHAYGMHGDALSRVVPGSAATPVKVRSALVEAATPAGGLVRAESPEGTRVWSLPARPSGR